MRPKGQKIMYYTGLIIGALGFMAGAAVSIAAAPLFGSIFTLFFVVVFGYFLGGQYLRGRRNKQLLAAGRRANGKIIEMWDTGITVNNQPQIGMVIEVTPASESPFKTEIKMVISRLQTAYYQAGVNCVVRYNPDDKKHIAIESIGGLNENIKNTEYIDNQFNASAGYSQGSPFFPGKSQTQIEEYLVVLNKEFERILQTGIECKAIIKNSEFTNIYLNGENPLNYFTLEVIPDNLPAFEAKCFGLISQVSIDKFQPGKQVWVKYDPADKTKITLSRS